MVRCKYRHTEEGGIKQIPKQIFLLRDFFLLLTQVGDDHLAVVAAAVADVDPVARARGGGSFPDQLVEGEVVPYP